MLIRIKIDIENFIFYTYVCILKKIFNIQMFENSFPASTMWRKKNEISSVSDSWNNTIKIFENIAIKIWP